jgi:anti-sigma factor RsiW
MGYDEARAPETGGFVKLGCHDVIPLLGAWLDRELGSDDAARVEGHVMDCPACSDRMALFAAQGEALRVAMTARASASADISALTRSVLAQVAERKQRRWVVRRPVATLVRRPVAAAMALAAAVAGVAIGLRTFSQPPAEAPLPMRVASIDEVDFRGAQGFVLQSGPTSIIWLREGTVR